MGSRVKLWIGKGISKTIDRLQPGHVLIALLLLIANGSLVMVVTGSVSSVELLPTILLTSLAMFVGWGLTAVIRSEWWAGSLALLMGMVAVLFATGRLHGPLLTLFVTAGRTFQQIIQWLWNSSWRTIIDYPPPDFIAVQVAFLELWVILEALVTSLFVWGIALTDDIPTFDPVATTLVWHLLLWAIAVWAGWVVIRRQHVLLGLGPMAAAQVIILAHAPAQIDYVIPFLAALLLLIGLIAHLRREHTWQVRNIGYPHDTNSEIALGVIIIAVALVVLAAGIPSV
ncbi:MAG: hypothetical protein AAF485_24780, partial [Chloroflexota bacterium]